NTGVVFTGALETVSREASRRGVAGGFQGIGFQGREAYRQGLGGNGSPSVRIRRGVGGGDRGLASGKGAGHCQSAHPGYRGSGDFPGRLPVRWKGGGPEKGIAGGGWSLDGSGIRGNRSSGGKEIEERIALGGGRSGRGGRREADGFRGRLGCRDNRSLVRGGGRRCG